MADYYPLLTRALNALPDRSPEMRRAVYERARTALTEQLRNLDPPLSEADIGRERLSLDEAIQRLEADQPPDPPPAPPKAELRPARSRDPAPLAKQPVAPAAETSPPIRTPTQVRAAPGDVEGEAPPPIEPGPRERPRVDTVAPKVARGGRVRSVVLGVMLAGVIGAIAVAAWFLRDRPSDLPRTPVVAEGAPPPENDGKIGDRVAGERAPTAPAAPGGSAGSAPRGDLAVAQRAILYEENQADPQTPKATSARIVWRLDNANVGHGQPLETIVRATIEIPDLRTSLNIVIRRNLDQTLPASHTIELAFTTPPGDPGRAVRDVGLLQFKSEEAVRGTPLSGLPVPVKENLFLIGLSNLPSDIERNTDLILNRNWIDLPIRFSSGQRAILSFEKGASGEQILKEAFRQWQP
jgi:hypothetical protein